MKPASHYLLSAELMRDEVASFAEHPFDLPAIAGMTRLDLNRAVTFLVGENGSGKSALHGYLQLARGVRKARDGFFLRAESFYNVATESERINSMSGLHEQSHGEAFMRLLIERFMGEGLYLLDEPEAALSPSRQMAMLVRMHELVDTGSQFIIATHSPILMAYPGAVILKFSDEGIAEVSYKETEHYVVTRMFLENPERMLRELVG